MMVEQPFDELVGAGIAREAQDRKRHQVGERQRLVVQAEAGRCHPAQWKVAQRQVLHHRTDDRIRLQYEIEVAARKLVDQVDCRVVGQFDLQLRIALVDRSNEVRKPGMDDRLDNADADHPDIQLAIGHALAHFVHGSNQPLRVDERLAAVERQGHVARAALEQAHTEILLKCGDSARHSGLRRVKLLGGHAKVPQLSQPHESLEEANVHGAVGRMINETRLVSRDDCKGFDRIAMGQAALAVRIEQLHGE